MLYNRNHCNLLFLCHPFRTYHSMKTNNNANCCLLLDNLANKKCILIQSRSRRLQFKISNNKLDKTAENGADSKMNPQKFLSKFETKYAEYKATHPMGIILYLTINGRKQFVDKFNNEHAKSGYKIEWDFKAFGKFVLIWLTPVLLLCNIIDLWLLDSVPFGDVAKEHAKIVAKPPITFDQFVQEYLPSGKINKIIYYPEKKLFVALIRRGALINGEPFTGPGLHVRLDLSFRRFPPIIPMMPLFVLERRIRVEEARIGLKKPTTIIRGNVEFDRMSMDDLSILQFLLLLFSIVCTGIQFYAIKKVICKQFWHVIPLNPKKK